MTDPQTAGTPATGTPASSLKVPDSVRQQFPDLVELVAASESMNDEERQYWFDILPVMTPEQVQNLRDILTNERNQLAAIDAKYAASDTSSPQDIGAMVEKRKATRQQLQSQETEARSAEENESAELLRKMQEL